MFKKTWCLREPGPGYHKLLVLNNIRMIFDSFLTAQTFKKMYLNPSQGWYIDEHKAFDFEIVLTLEDVKLRDWKSLIRRFEDERKQGTVRNYVAAG